MALSKVVPRGRAQRFVALGASLAAASSIFVFQPTAQVAAAPITLDQNCAMADASAAEFGNPLVSSQIRTQITATTLPLSIPGNITATATVMPGGVIHTTGTLNVDIQPYALNILENQVKPGVAASYPNLATTAFLNLTINNLKSTFNLPPQISAASNLVVTHTGSVNAVGSLSPGKIDVTLGQIRAGAYSLNPATPSGSSSTTSTSIPTLAPFSVTLNVDGTVDPSTPAGTVIQLHPGPMTFDLNFEVGVYFFGESIIGGVSGPEICTPTTPDAVLASSEVVAPRFNDVPVTHPFYGDIEWLASSGYANGYPDGGFHPSANIARQAMAAFLYRYAGSPNGPAPTCSEAPYTDVPIGAPFCGEISWMKTQNITTGYPDGGFHPAASVARQAMAAFLYRYAKATDSLTCSAAPYTDVPIGAPFCGEITWMKTQNITTGYPDGGFHPASPVARQAMAAFLHRYYNNTH